MRGPPKKGQPAFGRRASTVEPSGSSPREYPIERSRSPRPKHRPATGETRRARNSAPGSIGLRKPTAPKGSSEEQSKADPWAMLHARRAQIRREANTARVDESGSPLFHRLPNRIQARAELSDGAKILFAYLLNVDSKDRKANVAPYQATLAEALHVDVRTIRRYLQELEEAFLLTVEKRGKGLSSVYHLHDPWTVKSTDDLIMPWKVQIRDRSQMSPMTGDRGRFCPTCPDISARVEDRYVRRNGHIRPEL